MTATQKELLERWGVLMDYTALGAVMHRSRDGLRLSLAKNGTDWARRINAAKVRIGRRVLFRTVDIAALIDQPTSITEPESTTTEGRVPDRARGKSAPAGAKERAGRSR
jgi:hypothetical protein